MNAQPTPGMQVTTFENPMGIDGFEFVEFAAPPDQVEPLHDYFRRMGFVKVARHKTRAISTYRQGDCTFLINEDPDSFAADFAAKHGPCACGFAIRVNKLAEWVRVQALKNGATPITNKELTKAVADFRVRLGVATSKGEVHRPLGRRDVREAGEKGHYEHRYRLYTHLHASFLRGVEHPVCQRIELPPNPIRRRWIP